MIYEDKIRKNTTITLEIALPLNEVGMVLTQNKKKIKLKFEVNPVNNETYGNNSYFKVSVVNQGIVEQCDVYFTKPEYFRHSRQSRVTTPLVVNSKLAKMINDGLSSRVIDVAETFDSNLSGPVLYLTCYQALIYLMNCVTFNCKDVNAMYSNDPLNAITGKFFPINYPMPDYTKLKPRK